MSAEKVGTVTLIAPNGVTVSVAESKLADRLSGGYRLAEPRVPPKKRPRTRAKKAQGVA